MRLLHHTTSSGSKSYTGGGKLNFRQTCHGDLNITKCITSEISSGSHTTTHSTCMHKQASAADRVAESKKTKRHYSGIGCSVFIVILCERRCHVKSFLLRAPGVELHLGVHPFSSLKGRTKKKLSTNNPSTFPPSTRTAYGRNAKQSSVRRTARENETHKALAHGGV